MTTRAKCRLCNDLIESMSCHHYVTCECGEISIGSGSDGGYIRCRANNPENLLRLDDEDNVILPPVRDGTGSTEPPKQYNLAKLCAMIDRIESLPPQSLYAPINHADYASLLRELLDILRAS